MMGRLLRMLGTALALVLVPLVPGLARAAPPAEAEYLASLDAKGWKSTPGGVRYRVVKAGPGTGPVPAPIDHATLNYRGTLLDGTVFDDTTGRKGKPAKLQLTRVIAGWREVVPMMRIGDTWEIAVPAALGYGVRGSASGKVPPNATLLFTLELLGISKPYLSGQ